MEYLHRVSKTDLARNVRQVIRNVQRGQTAIIENHGQPEAAILEIVDYQILKAAARFNAQPEGDQELTQEVNEQMVAGIKAEQERYNRIIGSYLAEKISLERASELLGLSRIDLQYRFARLDVPLRLGSANEGELRKEIDAAQSWTGKHK